MLNKNARKKLLRIMNLKNLHEIPIFIFITVLYTMELIKHQLWRDETQAWLIAIVSKNPHQLINNLKYESRPPLWYFILKAFSVISENPNTMKLVSWTLAIISFIFILRTKSISLGYRTGWLFGFYFFFGYTVVTRDYVLIHTLVTVLVFLRLEKPKSRISYHLTLLALGSINLFGFFLVASWVIAITFVNRNFRWEIFSRMRTELMIFFVTTFQILIFRSPKDSQFNLNFHSGINHIVFEMIGNLRDAVLPFNFSAPSKNLVTFFTFLFSVIILIFIFIRIDNFAKSFLGIFTSLFLFNSAFGYSEYWWHRGTLVIAIFIALTLGGQLKAVAPAKAPSSAKNALVKFSAMSVPFFILLQVAGALFGYGASFYRAEPYSNISVAAKFVLKNCDGHCQIIGDSGVFAAGISASLKGRSIYSVDRNNFGTFAIWKRGYYSTPSWNSILAATDRYPDNIIITTILDQRAAPPNLKLLAKFAPSMWGDDYYIYRRIN